MYHKLDETTYVGEWKNGGRHGQGTATYIDEIIEKGIWKKGKLIKKQ